MGERLASGQFDFEDFLDQLRQLKRLGSVTDLLKMIPGMNQIAKDVNPQEATKNLKMVEAIISSMTIHERQNPHVLNGSRRRRIATGSGTTVNDVNQLVKQFKDMQKMMKQMGVMGGNRAKKRGRKGGRREGGGLLGGNLMDMFNRR